MCAALLARDGFPRSNQISLLCSGPTHHSWAPENLKQKSSGEDTCPPPPRKLSNPLPTISLKYTCYFSFRYHNLWDTAVHPPPKYTLPLLCPHSQFVSYAPSEITILTCIWKSIFRCIYILSNPTQRASQSGSQYRLSASVPKGLTI